MESLPANVGRLFLIKPNMNKEIKETDLLLGIPEVVLETHFFGFRIKWKMAKMTLGRMLQLSRVYAKIQIDEEALESEDIGVQMKAQYLSVKDNTELAVKVLAISVESRWPKWILKRHFIRSIDSIELQKFTYKVLQNSNFANFTMSIFLMNGSRIMKPKKVE